MMWLLLKAKKLEAMASAKLDAIEQSVEKEDLLTKTSSFKLKHGNANGRTGAWISDQEQIVMSDDIEIHKKQIHDKEPVLDGEITNCPARVLFSQEKLTSFKKISSNPLSYPVDIEHCVNEISATNERSSAIARQFSKTPT